MSKNALAVAMGFLGVLAIAIIASAILYGCEKSGERYHDLAGQCIHSGGTWLPTNGAGDAVCVGARP